MVEFNGYFTRPGVRWSLLRQMWKGSPLHYQHALNNPTAGDTPSREALRAIHCAVLEPDRWRVDFAPYVGVRRGGVWTAWQAENRGVTGLTASAWQTATDIAAAVNAHPVAGPLLRLRGGESEVELEWTDEATGLLCRGRADYMHGHRVVDGVIPPARRWALDLKTVGDCSLDEIERMSYRMGWHGQGAHYVAGGRLDAFGLVCVEQRAPHDVAVFWMSAGLLEAGEALRRRLIDRVAECTASGHWPGRHESALTLEPPQWATDDITAASMDVSYDDED